MKNNSLGPLFFFFIIFIITTSVCVLGLRKKFNLVSTAKTWQEARDHCRSHHTDLATIRSQEEADHLPNLMNGGQYWFGLHRDTRDPAVWRWTELVEAPRVNAADYTNWASRHEPESRNCTCMTLKSKVWHSLPCHFHRYPLCSDGSTFHLVKPGMSWQRAQLHCEREYQSLATITAENIMEVDVNTNHVWIGLFRDVDDEWKWVGETQSDFRNWIPGEPDNQDCGLITNDAAAPATGFMWQSRRCPQKKLFLCYEEKLVLVRENKTWEEALEFCRTLALDPRVDPAAYRNHRYDLASLLSDDDHLYAREKILAAVTDEVWTGLRFLAGQWLWVNGDELRHRGPPLRPSRRQHCGTLPKDRARPWEVRDCRDRRNFLCFQRK